MTVAGALLVVVTCICGTAVPGRAQTNRPASTADTNVVLIEWSKNRQLTRADFKAAAPPAGGLAARSSIDVKASWTCKADRLVTSIRAVFDPARSWWGGPNLSRFQMWNGTPADRDAQLLQHEQTHFDLAEVVARNIRRHLGELTDVCTRKNGTIPLAAVVEDFQRELDSEQERYDRETNFGTDVSEQFRWTNRAFKALSDSR